VFTGIVRELGRIDAMEPGDGAVRLRVRAPLTAGETSPGDSIALNGVCLTATEVEDGVLAFDAVTETLRRSTLGRLAAAAAVNVEPALRAGEPLGGHLVQGHVDGVGRVRQAAGDLLEIAAPPEVLRYCVEKGSIAIDGVSMTVVSVDDDAFAVAVIPHTREVTTLGRLSVGDEVNLEADVLGKYVEKLLGERGTIAP
jgi:riboflavin synthase